MSLIKVLAVVALGCVSVVTHAEELDAWLDKMKQAMNSKNYEGTLVIRQQDHMQVMHVLHGVGEKGSWEVMESTSGENRQVIRRNGQVTTIFPTRHLLTIRRDLQAPALRPQLPENRDILRDYYQFDLVGEDRIARKPTQVLQVKPKDQYRYGFRFWLDKESGLLLKCDLLNAQGGVVEQVMFSDLKILDESPVSKAWEEDHSDYRIIDLDEGRVEPTGHEWRVDKLPVGFKLTSTSTKPSNHGDGLVHQLVFSDGMASVSVFVEDSLPENTGLAGFSSMGALNAYGQPIKGHHVTVIGEVPEATVRLIAESIYNVHDTPAQPEMTDR